MTVLVCPACGKEETRKAKHCAACGCYLPPLLEEERKPQPIERRIGSVAGRPTNTDAVLIEQLLRESYAAPLIEQQLTESYTARVDAMYRIAMADWDDHLRAGAPESHRV